MLVVGRSSEARGELLWSGCSASFWWDSALGLLAQQQRLIQGQIFSATPAWCVSREMWGFVLGVVFQHYPCGKAEELGAEVPWMGGRTTLGKPSPGREDEGV